MYPEPALFSKNQLSDFLHKRGESITSQVDAVGRDQFLNATVDTLVGHFTEALSVEPITLLTDEKTLDHEETQVDVSGDPRRVMPIFEQGPVLIPGLRLTLIIPFKGEAHLLDLRPSSYVMAFPRGRVGTTAGGGNELRLLYERPSDDMADLKGQINKDIELLQQFLSAQRRDIQSWNSSLPQQIRQAVEARRSRISSHDSTILSLGIALRRNNEAPIFRAVPLSRKLVRPLPAPPREGYKPEPGIAAEDFEHILSVIRHEARTAEAAPKTFASFDEESLRDLLLAHLNGHYLGDATGETFRKTGKTDIRIEVEKRAAFIAELKVWRGPSQLTAACDQLLAYLTWRDCKAALVVYNKHNARFSEILAKLPATLRQHPNFRREGAQEDEGEWRFTFASRHDDAREITVQVFLVDLYSDASSATAVEHE